MLIISGEHLAAMIPGHSFTVVANAAMIGNEAVLFCQKLNVSWSVAELLTAIGCRRSGSGISGFADCDSGTRAECIIPIIMFF
jgi:hypothetical protein